MHAVMKCSPVLLLSALSLIACSGGEEELPPALSFTSTGQAPAGDPCDPPQEGCGCDEPGAERDCGTVVRHSADYITCSYGKMTCGTDGSWGVCEGDEISILPVPETGARPQALGSPEPCTDNPCDPYCISTIDTGVGIVPPPDGFTSGPNGLTITPQPPEVTPPCTGLNVTPTTQQVTVTQLLGSSGLYAEFFDDWTWDTEIPAAWTPVATRRDETINFSWGRSAPGPAGIGDDNFSIRWTGQLLADETTNFYLHTVSDDGIRVWLDGQLLIDRWQYQGPTEVVSNALPLTEGETYDLRVEYFEAGGGAVSKLYWSTGSRARTIVPAANLLPPAGMADGFTTSPESIQFEAELQPPDCFNGVSQAAWTLSRFDTAAIDETGLLRVFAGVSSEMLVSAYLGEFSNTAKVEVVVDVLEDDTAPAGSVAALEGASAGADTASFLYPYANTILPLGLAPLLVQYDDGGTAADAVKLSLRYPATGTPSFQWSTVVEESTPPQIAIPVHAWKAFEQTAKGDTAALVIQRLVSGSPRDEIVRSIQFADAPVRGRIYYTQYGRKGGTKLMVADPGSAEPAADAFGSSDGCPVCHSVSAQGNVVATSNMKWSDQGGISEILSDGTLNPLADISTDAQYRAGAQDWRGFAWAPLSPDGSLALTGNNMWGNAKGGIVGIDKTTDTVDVPDELLSGANGTGLLAEYFSDNSWGSDRWASYVPHIDFDFDAGGPGGPIGSDFTASYSGEVMAYFDEDYVFSVTSTGGVRLIVDGVTLIDSLSYSGVLRTQSASIPMSGGQRVSIQLNWRDTSGDAQLALDWESPNTPFARVPVDQLWANDGLRGVLASFYSDRVFGAFEYSSLEPEIDADFGNAGPMGLADNDYSTRWEGQLEAPLTGVIRLCVRSDDDVDVEFAGSSVISQNGVVNTCSADLAVTEGDLYELRVDHVEISGGSYVELSWESSSFSRSVISGAYLSPPASYSLPTTGLTASYYDGSDFRTGLDQNPDRPGAMRTYVPDINSDWGSERPNYSVLTNSNSFSVRYTGQIQLPCDGIYEFRNIADNESSAWIGEQRILHNTSSGTSTGAAHFTAGLYDFKYQVVEGSGDAAAELAWIPRCQGASSYVPIPEGAFRPGDGDLRAGFVRAGGDNTGSQGYWVWSIPPASGAEPVDVTNDTAGRWGLGGTTMMVPAFSPAGDRLVYVDGDSGNGAGWRKGLSVYDFDQGGKLFSNRRSIVNHWPYGDVIKWPVFESDSRSVLYQTSTPADWCCKGGWTNYGHMAPTNYFEIPGLLWSVDSDANNPTPVELKTLNEGERSVDANKSYQPTMLPEATGGYRWVVFTSTRPYGNTFNLPGDQSDYSDPTSFTPMVKNDELQSMLWVAAVDDEASDASDRSHPAFLLPNQNYSETPSDGYLNERGFWALEECRATGETDASLCEVDEDCCGNAVCRLDTPVSSPPTRHCQARPSADVCTPRGDGCNDSSDCCLGDVCVAAQCAEAPPLETLNPVNYTRTFESDCDSSTGVIWRFFDWQAETPGDSYIEIYAESVDDPSEFSDLEVAPDGVSSTNAVGVGLIAGDTITNWVGNDVAAQLEAAGLPHRKYLRVTMRFIPSSDSQYTPRLTTWRQAYDCFPDQ